MKASQNPQRYRWILAAAGIVILLFAGVVYAWSVLSGPIAQEYPDWTKAQLSLSFTIVMVCYCIGCMAGGFLNGKISPRIGLALSALLLLAGFLLSSRIQSLAGLYVSFGVICGFSSGFAYNIVMSTVGKWFPDKQGLISGILLMGFGIGSFLIGKAYQMLTPTDIGAWRHSFAVLGAIAAVCLLVCGLFLKAPPADFVVSGKKTQGQKTHSEDVTTAHMLRRPAFWLYYLWAILLSAAGLILVSQASGIASEVGISASAGTIATVVGMISVFNGIGRVIMGGMFDRFGRSATMQTVNILFLLTGVILITALKTNSFALIIIGFICAGLSYGGVTPTNSAFVSAYFGMKHYPLNLSMVNTNLIFASFGSTIAGALYDATQSYMSSYLLILAMAFLGIFVSFAIGLGDKRASH